MSLTNVNCPAQLKERLQHFASRRGLDITGLGGKRAEQLVDKGFVKNLPDIYQLRKDDLLQLEMAEAHGVPVLQENEFITFLEQRDLQPDKLK